MVITKRRRRHAGTLAFVVFVLAADIVGAALSYLYGATIATWFYAFFPWLAAVLLHFFHGDLLTTLLIGGLVIGLPVAFIQWSYGYEWKVALLTTLGVVLLCFLLRVPFHLQVTSFIPDGQSGRVPNFWSALTHRNRVGGTIWLVIYLAIHLYHHDPDAIIPEVQQRQEEKAKRKKAARGVPRSMRRSTTRVEGNLQDELAEVVVLNPLYLSEDKAILLKHCVQRYEKALTRFSPPPLRRLLTPTTFFYVTYGNRIVYQGRTLILTEFLLNAVNGAYLLTEFARALFAYNTTDLWLRRFMQFYPDLGCWSLLLFPVGIFHLLPALVKEVLGWHDWRATRVLNADRFAWILGQGELLLHQLRQRQEAGQEEMDADMPTITERMGQLQELLNEEHTQMQRQGIPTMDELLEIKTAPRLTR